VRKFLERRGWARAATSIESLKMTANQGNVAVADPGAGPAFRRPPRVASATERGSTRATSPRIFLMLVLIAAAMPYRIPTAIPLVHSISVLDILLIVAAVTLFLDLATRPTELGYLPLFALLCVPFFVASASLVWSEDRAETLRSVLVYGEGLVAYLFVVRELTGVSPDRIMIFVKRYAYLLIIPGVLLLLHVPGFEPQQAGLSESSGDYISFYTRLSHPILGRSNNLATVLAMLAPLLLFWGHHRKDRRLMVAAFVTLAAIAMTQSRGAFLALLLAGILYAPFAVSRRRTGGSGLGGRILAAVMFALIGFAVLYTINPATQEYFAGRLTLANVKERSTLASEALDEIGRRPMVGYGAGVRPAEPNQEQAELNELIATVEGRKHAAEATDVAKENVHNAFLEQVVYYGIPLGIAVCLSLCGLVAFVLARRSNLLAGVIAYTLIVQLVLFLFESSFEGTVLRVLFYLGVGLAVAAMRSVDAGTVPDRLADP
jgi:O-Antigen ligase